MKISKFLLLAFLGLLVFASCTEDDPVNPVIQPEGAYVDGFFITNEGQFPGPGSVSFVSNDLTTVEQHIFEKANGEDPGAVIQSMFFDQNGHAYIIANNTNLISVVDRYTFKKVGEITADLDKPRYGVVADGKAYVTNGKYVAVIDLETLKSMETISFNGKSVEYILLGDNGMLYAMNASFGTGNTISIIDPSSNTVTKTIQTASGLNDIAVENEVLYALTATTIEKHDLLGNKLATITLNYARKPGDMEVENNKIYFTVDKSVYDMSLSSKTAPTQPLFTYESSSAWGAMYGFDVEGERIYIADGGDFASDSFIEIHDLEGNLIKKVEVGVAPNAVYINH